VLRSHDASFERVLNSPPRGIGSAVLDALQTTATARGMSLSAAAQHHLRGGYAWVEGGG
jgi:superfamily I DNA/RNA helicase